MKQLKSHSSRRTAEQWTALRGSKGELLRVLSVEVLGI